MKISIIIPTLNEEDYLGKILSHTLTIIGDFEIIVVDGGSTDDTRKISNGFKSVKTLVSEKGRANQMNHGALNANGDIFLFLHADTLLPQNAYQKITNQLEKPGYIGGSFKLRLDKAHPILKFYTWCSRFSLEFFTYGDHCIFIKKTVFKEIDGYKKMPFLEDVEIQKRLRKKGKFKKLKASVLTSGRRFNKSGTFRQLITDVLLVLFYKLGASPIRLKKFYKD